MRKTAQHFTGTDVKKPSRKVLPLTPAHESGRSHFVEIVALTQATRGQDAGEFRLCSTLVGKQDSHDRLAMITWPNDHF